MYKVHCLACDRLFSSHVGIVSEKKDEIRNKCLYNV
jgi:hypothetical protein